MTSHGATRREPGEWTIDAIEKSIEQIVNW